MSYRGFGDAFLAPSLEEHDLRRLHRVLDA